MLKCSLALCLLVSLFAPIAVFAKENLANWKNVKKVKKNSSVYVVTKNSDSYLGKVIKTSDDSIEIYATRMTQVVNNSMVDNQNFNQNVTLKRDELFRVGKIYEHPKRRQVRAAIVAPLLLGGIGAAIGFGVDKGLGKAGVDTENSGLVFGAILGGGFGLLLPLLGSSSGGKLIYQAP
jgi:hypothetical protein